MAAFSFGVASRSSAPLPSLFSQCAPTVNQTAATELGNVWSPVKLCVVDLKSVGSEPSSPLNAPPTVALLDQSLAVAVWIL